MRAYRALLHLFPASFRAEYGGEMCAIMAQRRREAAGPVAVVSPEDDVPELVVLSMALEP